MGKTKFSPGGGAVPCRPDEKMSSERFCFSYPGHNTDDHPNHKAVLRKMMKKAARKKRRQRDRIF